MKKLMRRGYYLILKYIKFKNYLTLLQIVNYNYLIQSMHQYILLQQGYPIVDPTTKQYQVPPCTMEEFLQIVNCFNTQSCYIKNLQTEIKQIKDQMSQLVKQIEILSSQSSQDQENLNVKLKKRRKYFQNKFLCPYNNCCKSYGSSLALNLHIKQKHNGGTKKQRQAYAKIIINCEEKGISAPLIECEFPPGFLQDERKKSKKE